MFSWARLVGYTQCDADDRMTCAGVLREAQEISMAQCEELGIGTAFMESIHSAFLLSKIRLTAGRYPRAGESIVVRTTPYRPEKIYYRRRVELQTPDGAPLCEVDSRWILVDTQTMRIQRRPHEAFERLFVPTEAAADFLPERGEAYAPELCVPVRRHMIDRNRHVNNVVYADLAADCVAEGTIREMELFYHHGATLGSAIDIAVERSLPGRVLVQGTVDGAPCFEATMRLQ